eukprot:TRINITY_DN3402_c0_g1_i1.p1 TRINITY_DN3402_c0_g1~~TRINITY_DN3402_c0_g1_i1.p1  ORF type:complete len:131 (-),score=21.81 TRINITY_DN3402_c0_g1_i1:37-429(-)
MMDSTLSRLSICQCQSQLQFETTLHAIVHSNSYDTTKLLVVDSLDCFYWQDRFSSFSFRKESSRPFHRALKQLDELRRFKGLALLLVVSERFQNMPVDNVATLGEDSTLNYHEQTFLVEVLEKGFTVKDV